MSSHQALFAVGSHNMHYQALEQVVLTDAPTHPETEG